MFYCREEEEGEDVIDSDFSIDENDEPISDNEDEKQRKTRRLVTKAYREPAASSSNQKPKPNKSVKSVPKAKSIELKHRHSTEYGDYCQHLTILLYRIFCRTKVHSKIYGC